MKRVALLCIAALSCTAALSTDAEARHAAQKPTLLQSPRSPGNSVKVVPIAQARISGAGRSGLVPLSGSAIGGARHWNTRLTSLGGAPSHTGTVALNGNAIRREH